MSLAACLAIGLTGLVGAFAFVCAVRWTQQELEGEDYEDGY